MVKKFIFLIFCLITCNVIVYGNELVEKKSKNVDRYQMQTVMNKIGNPEVYLLDKENGTIWMTKNSIAWVGGCNYDAWVQLPPLPIQERE